MLLLLLALTLTPIAVAPLMTHGLYGQAYRVEYRQIALDNAAIGLGRGQRAAFRYLAETNRKLRALEAVHHPAHACARLPQPTPACLAADRSAELAIRTLRNEAYAAAQIRWASARGQARTELGRWQVEATVHSPVRIPVAPVRCPLCGLDVFWERESDRISSDLVSPGAPWLGVRVALWGRSLTRLPLPDYELRAVDLP
jgi:hypothetical protein